MTGFERFLSEFKTPFQVGFQDFCVHRSLIKGRELDFLVSQILVGVGEIVKQLAKDRELDFPVSPLYKRCPELVEGGGLRGVKPGSQSNSDLCVHRSPVNGEGLGVGCYGTFARGLLLCPQCL